MRYTFDLDREIKELEERAWRIFGARVRGRLTGGVAATDSPWDTAYLRLVRADSPRILRLDQTEAGSAEAASA